MGEAGSVGTYVRYLGTVLPCHNIFRNIFVGVHKPFVASTRLDRR